MVLTWPHGPSWGLVSTYQKNPQDFESCHKIRSSLVAQEPSNWGWRSVWDLEGFVRIIGPSNGGVNEPVWCRGGLGSSKRRQFWGFRKHRKNTFFQCLSMTFHCYWVEEHTKIYSPVGCLDLKFLKDRKLRLASLKPTANELKISRSPKDKNHLPTINFQMLSCDSSKHGSLDIRANWPEKWFLGGYNSGWLI